MSLRPACVAVIGSSSGVIWRIYFGGVASQGEGEGEGEEDENEKKKGVDNEGLCVIQGKIIFGGSENSQALPAHHSDKGCLRVWKSIEVQKASERVVCFW